MNNAIVLTLFVFIGVTLQTVWTNKCPDQTHECPDGWTCCKMKSGVWGCCPLPEAVCCADGAHCCPSGSTCSAGSCMHQGLSIPWFTKIPAVRTSTTAKPCSASSKQVCAGTCCQMTSGKLACCPLQNAVCCNGTNTCCPAGSRCDPERMKCFKPQSARHERFPLALTPPNPLCPGGKQQCPNSATCCSLVAGRWACCPSPKAVCCSDHLHCCPHGTKCDVAEGKCLSEAEVTEPSEAKIRSAWSILMQPSAAHKHVDCSSCHERLCCKRQSGRYGCCPLNQGTCCKDTETCCPAGASCSNDGNGKCIKHGKPTAAHPFVVSEQPYA